MKRRKFLFSASGLLLVPAFPAIVQAQFLPKRRGSVSGGAGGGGGGDNIAFRSEAHSTSANGNGATLTEPSGAASNDIFIALAACDTSSTSLGIPAGWTSLLNGTSAGPLFKYNLAWIRRGGSAPSLVWTMSGSFYREVKIIAYSGCVAAGSPVEAQTDGGNTSVINPDCPSVTTLHSNSYVIAVAVNWGGSSAGGWTAPTGYTNRSSNANGDDTIMSAKKVAAAGAEDPAAYANGSGSNQTWTSSIALQSS